MCLFIWLMQNKTSTETNICISHICLFSWTAAISFHFNYTWCSISFGNKNDKMSRPIDLLSWKIKQREKWNTKCCSPNSIQFHENVRTIVLFRFSILTLFYSLFLEYLPFYLKTHQYLPFYPKKHHPISMLFQGKHLSKLKTKKGIDFSFSGANLIYLNKFGLWTRFIAAIYRYYLVFVFKLLFFCGKNSFWNTNWFWCWRHLRWTVVVVQRTDFICVSQKHLSLMRWLSTICRGLVCYEVPLCASGIPSFHEVSCSNLN